MLILPTQHNILTRDICAFLKRSEQIEALFEEATGDPVSVATNDTRAGYQQISDILNWAETWKKEHWFLTYVLIAALEDEKNFDKLRKRLVEACPEALITTANLEQQVDRMVDCLQQMIAPPLPSGVRDELLLKQTRLKKITQNTARLLAYKSLHESLHALQLKLTFREKLSTDLDEETDTHIAIRSARTRATEAAALLGADADDKKGELEWIDMLDPVAIQLEAAARANDRQAEHELVDDLRNFIQLHLIRLNGCVFTAARELSFPEIVADAPLHFRNKPVFKTLEYALWNVKTAVLARALKHRLWQDAEKELLLIDALLDVPGPLTDETHRQWLKVKSRIVWLAERDPSASWKDDAKPFADKISDAMAASENWKGDKAWREDIRKMIALCFFAIDAIMKAESTTLLKLAPPLTSLLKELGCA